MRLALSLLICAAAMAAQPPLVPLLWTQGQGPDVIRKAVREVAEGGNTGFVWESRPHPDYLGPQWWADLGVAVDEARKLKLEVWIFDEWMYPSGVAGGKVVAANPKFALHTVEERALTVHGPAADAEYAMPGEGKVIAVMAMPEKYDAKMAPVALPASAKVRWAAPAGNWRIVFVVERTHVPTAGWKMSNMVDVMNPAATAEFIRITHEATYQHFKADFGTTIKGFFSDETGFRNITSYESLPGKPGMLMPWSPVFAAYFEKLKGYDLKPWLPALWYDLGPRTRAVRADFVDVCSHAFAEHFFKPQQEWCHAHGVKLIGHLVEDNHADHNLGYGPGHWFRSQAYLDMPGIDVVGFQVTPGVDAGNVRWTTPAGTEWDQEFFSFEVPAMARGAALIQNTREMFSELFGAYGWNEGLRMVQWIGDWHIVNGFTTLSPHALTMKYNDPDCPPHFNATGGSAQARYYKDWARHIRPLQALVSDTDARYDAGVLYTAESAWAGAADNAGAVVRVLETSQVSTAVIPYDAIAKVGRRLPALVLPNVRYLPAETVEQLADYMAAGGRVYVLERWPEGPIDAREQARFSDAMAKLKRAHLTTLWELPGLMSGQRVKSEQALGSVMVAWREGRGAQWLMLHNRSLANEARSRLAVKTTARHAVLWLPETDTFRAVPHQYADGRLMVDVDLDPSALWVLRLSDELPKVVEKTPVYARVETPQLKWTASHDGKDAGGVQLQDWRVWPQMENYAGTVRYRTTLRVEGTGAVALDFGAVEETGELFVNGKSLGVKLTGPYRWDITKAAHAGENVIELEVTNTTYARWKDVMSHGDAVSGLLGPVNVLHER